MKNIAANLITMVIPTGQPHSFYFDLINNLFAFLRQAQDRLIKDIRIHELHARLTGRAGISTKSSKAAFSWNKILLIRVIRGFLNTSILWVSDM